jgi:hypothetical protein
MALRLSRTAAGMALGLWVLGTVPIHAAWPSAIIIYGGSLGELMALGPSALAGSGKYRFLYGASTDIFRKELADRPHFQLAIHWGAGAWRGAEAGSAILSQFPPEAANQHGRLYPPAGGEPAVVVATPYMAGSACARDTDGQPVRGLGRPRAIPEDAKGFPCGWTLTEAAVKTLQDLGLPGF